MIECRWCLMVGWRRGPFVIVRAFGWHSWLGLRLERGYLPLEFYLGRLA